MNREKRTPVIAGNWKMNSGSPAEASALLGGLLEACPKAPACEVVVCPPATALALAAETLRGSAIALGAQNCHFAPSGAYTGEVSAAMLTGVGCTHVIIGHSERRQYFGETNETAGKRLAAAVAGGLCGILCVGESLEQREAGQEIATCAAQLAGGLAEIPAEALAHVMIAYEPVWAIGPGKIPPDQAYITKIADYVKEVSGGRDVVYGGGLKQDNAKMLSEIPSIDGGLIALTRFSGEIGFYPEEYLEIAGIYLGLR